MADNYSPTEEEVKKITKALKIWKKDWDNARPYFESAKEDLLAYKSFRDPNSHPYKYNPTSPLVFTIVENMASTVFNSFFLKENPITILPMEWNHQETRKLVDNKIASQLEKVLNNLFMHPDREFMLDVHDLAKETITYGNGYTMMKPVFDKERESTEGGPLYLGPKVQHISFWDIIPDSDSYRFSNSRHLWFKEWVSFEELEMREETENYTNIKYLKDNHSVEYVTDYHRQALSELGFDFRSNYNDEDDTYMILHKYDFKTEHWFSLAGSGVIIRDTSIPVSLGEGVEVEIPPFPYNPFNDLRLWPWPKEFFAQGVGSVVKGFQDEMNLWKSMRLENVELSLHKVFMVNPNYNIDIEDLFSIPGHVIETNDIDRSLKVLETDDVTRNAYVERTESQSEAQDAASSQETTRGNQAGRREAATTILTLNQNAMKRTQTFLKEMSIVWFRSIIIKGAIQVRTYMTKDEYQRILGEDDAGFFELTATEIEGLFDIKPSNTSIDGSRELAQQNVLNGQQLLQNYEDLMKRNAVAKFLFETYFPEQDANRFIKTDEDIQLEQQQAMQQAQAEQGGQGNGAPSGKIGPQVGEPNTSPEQLQELTAEGRNGGQQGF